MKYRLESPEILVSLNGVKAKDPALRSDGSLALDALTPLVDLVRSPLVLEKVPLLSEAAHAVASQEIRNMGTLGGNICLENRCTFYNQSHTFQYVEPCFKRGGDLCYLTPGGKKCLAVFSADTVPALISLGAIVDIEGPGGSRQVPLEKLYTGDALNPRDIRENELITGVIIPKTPNHRRSAFIKFSIRGGVEFGALSIAVTLDMDDNGVSCEACRIVAGSVSASPLRIGKAEEILSGQPLSEALHEEAARAVSTGAHPSPHHGYTAGYLRECLRIQTMRALAEAAGAA
jgi:CO/xanthine dehydrogenase FAD-binding subunit